MKDNKLLIYIILGLILLISLSSLFKNVRDEFFPPNKTYTLEEAKMMLKHDSIINHNSTLVIKYNVIEKENEEIRKNIPFDSIAIFDGSRKYRDSLRAIHYTR